MQRANGVSNITIMIDVAHEPCIEQIRVQSTNISGDDALRHVRRNDTKDGFRLLLLSYLKGLGLIALNSLLSSFFFFLEYSMLYSSCTCLHMYGHEPSCCPITQPMTRDE